MSILDATTRHTASKLFTLVCLLVPACPLQTAAYLVLARILPSSFTVVSLVPQMVSDHLPFDLRRTQSVLILKLSEQNELYAKVRGGGAFPF